MALPQKDYAVISGHFYESQRKSPNPLRSWFHNDRFSRVRALVGSYYREGMSIVDLGCGSCEWNDSRLPILGVDISQSMLDTAIRKKTISARVLADIRKTPLKSNSADIVVCSEVLEHFNNPEEVLKEISRILKPGGKLVCTVPYDSLLSLWKPFFFFQCALQGWIFGNPYYKNRCGHITSFSPSSLKKKISGAGLATEDVFDNFRFTIFLTATKK